VETASAGYGSAAWKDVFVLAVLVTLLIFRPEGLFATRRVRSADEPL
jgi:branched-subunit amino acid ABC-type transport system permease component